MNLYFNDAKQMRPNHLERCLCWDKFEKGYRCYVYDDISKYWCTQSTTEHDPDAKNEGGAAMNLQEAIEILRQYNVWRRYDGPIGEGPEMLDPKTIGDAIDVVCNTMKDEKVQNQAG